MKNLACQSRRKKDKNEGRRPSHLDLRTRHALHAKSTHRRLLVDAAVSTADSDSAVVMVVVKETASGHVVSLAQTGYHVSGYSRPGHGSV